MNLHTSINLAVLHIIRVVVVASRAGERLCMYLYGKDIYSKPFSLR